MEVSRYMLSTTEKDHSNTYEYDNHELMEIKATIFHVGISSSGH